jgi:K+/H+ antiporter YhaU regulatory subunit KhtT
VFAGKKLRNISLRSDTGVSILAVSRAGSLYYDPLPDVRIYPGDRLILMGPPEELRAAESLLNQIRNDETEGNPERFQIEEISADAMPSCIGTTLAESSFRQRHGVTVVGIRRGEEKITSPTPTETIRPGDHLIVIGSSDAVDALKAKALSGTA